MFKSSFFVLVLFIALFSACVPNNPKNVIGFNMNLTSKDVQQAFEAGYKHANDTLFELLHDANPTIRFITLNSFASSSDSTLIDSIAPLLKDSEEKVRTTAAYVLGQLRSVKAEHYLIDAFVKFDSLNNSGLFNATILEALGKCGSRNSLQLMTSVKSYTHTDSLLTSGLAKGVFRYALRNMYSKAGNSQMFNYLYNKQYSDNSRLYAAHYFSKLPATELKSLTDSLISLYNVSNKTDIRIPLINAISKGNPTLVVNFINGQLKSSSNPQLRYALINGVNQLSYKDGDTLAITYIKDKDDQIAQAAGLYLFNHGSELDAKRYFDKFLSPETNRACQLELLGAVNKYLPYTPINYQLKQGVNAILKDSLLRLPDVYRKADIIKYLGGDVTNFSFIRDVTKNAPDKIIQVAGMESYGDILANPYFAKIYRSNYIPYKKQIFSYLIEGLLSGDVGVTSTAAVTLRRPELDFKTFLPGDSIFKIALKKIKLPEGAEAYNEVAKTLSFWNGLPPRPLPDKGFRMLDWAVLNNITDSTQCQIITNRGKIDLRLLPSVAPLSVANWIELVKRNYYNGKIFHRVIPNFVIQSGCNRGDGFGSLDYLIRSELPMVYYNKPGMVGMASAGPNTENCQFFITSAPTPHLDGRYTIFAEVISGEDVVKHIKRGDIIKKITIK